MGSDGSHPNRAEGRPRLTFLGGARTVTGSKTLIDTPGGRLLVDCGLFQGRKKLRLQNWDRFPVDPASVDAVLLTHAHIDHCGYLPRLARHGFTGRVLCTDGTRRLAEIVLPDSGHLHEEEAAYANRVGYSKHHPALPLYTEDDAVASLSLFETVPFDRDEPILPGVRARWQRAGHILGAASIVLHVEESDTRVVFSGDLGRPTHPLLLPPRPIGAADVVITESTYGDEDHDRDDPDEVMAELIKRHGPTGRGDDRARLRSGPDRGRPLAPRPPDRFGTGAVAPRVRRQPHGLPSARCLRVRGAPRFVGDPARAPGDGAVRLDRSDRGSHDAGVEGTQRQERADDHRVRVGHGHRRQGHPSSGQPHHDHRNAVLLVGFQAPGTRGDKLRHGASKIRMFGKDFPVAARVETVELSAHADRADLLRWLGTASPPPRVVYVNHGEPAASDALVETIERRLRVPAVAPEPGERFWLDAEPATGSGPPR